MLFRSLPDPFLRRCIFHYIDFPGEDLMEDIVNVHYPDIDKKLLREALKKFYWIRQFDMLRKKPSTSELIDWLQALMVGGISVKQIEKEIPFLGTLLKKKEDTDLIEKSGKNHHAYNSSMRTRDVY